MNVQMPTYEQLLAENSALRDEVRRLRGLLGLETPTVEFAPAHIAPQQPEQLPNLNKRSSTEQKIELFMSLFKGRDDVYAKRWYSERTQKSGYSPMCLNEWERGICEKPRVKCAGCPNRSLARLNDRAIYRHLEGRSPIGADVVGVYPLTLDECCRFLAIDFDDDDWERDVSAFRESCGELGIALYVERSRSGNGAHVWFFFEEPIAAKDARRFGTSLLTYAMSKHHELKFSSYDRLLPNQDIMPNGGFGNLIALPLQGLARRSDNSVFVDDVFNPYPDQWSYLASIRKLSFAEVDEITRRLSDRSELGTLSDVSDDGNKPWEQPKPLPALTANDFSVTVELVRANMLHVPKSGVSQRALNQIKRLAAFRNPDFYKAQAMRLPVYNKPRIIDCSEDNGEYLSIPRGCEDALMELLGSSAAAYTIDDKRNIGAPIAAAFNGTLRGEQIQAADALLRHDNGILSATTAFGKTVIGAHIISERKVSTLVLVHTSALLQQWKKSLAQFLDGAEIGQIGASKNAPTGQIDIATMQSLVTGEDVKPLVRDYGMVIVDECHHVSAVSFERILKTVTAKYVYGLTATPTRQDGQHPIIYMQCGIVRYQVDAKAQAAKQGFGRFVIPRFTQFKKPPTVTGDYNVITQIYADIAESSARNKMIVADVLDALGKGRTPIILTQRAAHVNALADALEKNVNNVIRLTGNVTAKTKRLTLERLKAIPNDEQFVIVATGKYVGEGFDEPRLDTLFLASPISWKGTLQQYAGRLHREREGKSDVIVYDYIDVNVRVLESMYHKRVSGYASMGYKTMTQAENADSVGVIFDSGSFLPTFEHDVSSARREIVIVSPYMRKSRAAQIMRVLSASIVNGAHSTIITRPPDSYKLKEQPGIIAALNAAQNAGVRVVTSGEIHHRFAVIDRSVVWYGSLHLLGYGTADESIIRFESSELAEALLSSI